MNNWTRVRFELADNECAGWTYARPDAQRMPFYVFLKTDKDGAYFQLQEVRDSQSYCTKSGIDDGMDIPPATAMVRDFSTFQALLRGKKLPDCVEFQPAYIEAMNNF